MKNQITLLVSLLVGLVWCCTSALAQLENTVSIQIDPNDWNQFVYRRSVTKRDSVLFHYWQRPKTEAQLFRVNWIRSQKIRESFSVNFGPGIQILKTKTDTDPQLFLTIEPVLKKGKFFLRNMSGFNISFRNPLVVKNITKVGGQVNKKTQLGYQSELLLNSRTGLRENYQGGTMSINLGKQISIGLFGYTNLSAPERKFHVRLSASFNF